MRSVGGRIVLWDFDGTLAQRPGLWSGCVLELLDEHVPGHTGTREAVRDALRGSFPWHRAGTPHPELCDADEWWAAMFEPLASAIEGCGVAQREASALAREVRVRFTDASRSWELFADSRPALEACSSAGWSNVVLSNHVPELPLIVEKLGLHDLLEQVFSSAATGYEKPHPEAFRSALSRCGDPSLRWMVGDNPVADVRGAEAVGIPAVLVRADNGSAPNLDLPAAVALILESS